MLTKIYKSCVGLDVHAKVIVATLLKEEEGGAVKKETKEFGTYGENLKALCQWISESSAEIVAMESTGTYWMTVFEALEDAGIKAIVVNARHMKNVPGRKTDVLDSEWIAELLRCGLLRASFIPPKGIRHLRLLTRYRRKLVAHGASEKQRLHKILDTAGIKLGLVVTDIDGKSAREMIDALIEGKKPLATIAQMARRRMRSKIPEIEKSLVGKLSDTHRFLLRQIKARLLGIDATLSELDSEILKAMDPHREQWKLLQTIPGIDAIAAAMIIAEIGTDMTCFGNKSRLSSWAGICPGNNESAGKKKSGKTSKGNQNLRSLLCETAHSASKTRSQFKSLFEGLAIRRGKKRAIIAVGHKQLEVIFTVLNRGKPYYDPQVNHEELMVKRNAPRWIKTLAQYGYISKAEKPQRPTGRTQGSKETKTARTPRS